MKASFRRPATILVMCAAIAAVLLAGASTALAEDGAHTATLPALSAPGPLSLSPLAVRSLPWQPLVDTYVYQRTPAVSNGRSTRLLAGRDRLGYEYWTLLRFKTSDLESGREPYVHRADLRLWLVGGGSGPMITGLAGFKPLTYENTTWYTKPGVKWLPELTRNVSGANRWVSVPVTDIVNRAMIAGPPRDDFIVSGSNPGAVWSFASSQEPYAPHRPKIDVVYCVPKGITREMRETTVVAGAGEVVTATVTQDMGAPWAGDIRSMLMYVHGVGSAPMGSLGPIGWFREPPGVPWETTAAPGAGWYGRIPSDPYVIPRYDQWSVSASPDGRKMSVTFAWTMAEGSPTGDADVQAEAVAVPPGGNVLRCVGVWPPTFPPAGATMHIVAPPD